MMKVKRFFLINITTLSAFALIVAALMAGCEENKLSLARQGYEDSRCVSCHMDKELLKEIADPIEHTEGSGEG